MHVSADAHDPNILYSYSLTRMFENGLVAALRGSIWLATAWPTG